MTHGVRVALILPYCLLSVGLHHAPAEIPVGLCQVDVMEGRAFSASALWDAWQPQ